MNFATRQVVVHWQVLEAGGLNNHVRINGARLSTVARNNALNGFPCPSWEDPILFPSHNLAFSSFQIVTGCLNFAFNIFEKPDEKYGVAGNGCTYTGSMALAWKMYEAFGESIIRAHALRRHFLSPHSTMKFFYGLNSIPLPALRCEVMKDFIEGLEKHFMGNPLNLLEEAADHDYTYDGQRITRAFGEGSGTGKGIVELLVSKFPFAYGSDVQMLCGLSFPFYKRAQLVAMILHGRYTKKNVYMHEIADIGEVGPLADYQVPRALRNFGILNYGEELADSVDNWHEIPKDSGMEIEIRAATVAACCALLDEINEIRRRHGLRSITMCELDYFLWSAGRAGAGRPHLVRTSAY